MLTEAKLIFERGSRESINNSINIFTRVIAKYPGTNSEIKAYYLIAQSYEKLGLNRLAYLKYIYILKNNKDLPVNFVKEIKTRLARLRVMRRHTEEGIHQLLGLLNVSSSSDFRSRVYTELGHTYLKVGKYRKSKRMFDIALSEKGDNEEAILGKARAYMNMGYSKYAFDLYEYFLKYYGNFSHYANDVRKSYLRQAYSKGYNSFRKGRYYEAISYFRRILRFFPYHNKSENSYYWIGESYLALKKYDSAIKYFNKVLSNSYLHKDQEAKMKKGYTYYVSGRFDLAAREFQRYIDSYPKGRYISNVKEWKKISTKEMLYRIRNKTIPEINDEDIEDLEEKETGSDKKNLGASAEYSDDEDPYDVEYENVAEL